VTVDPPLTVAIPTYNGARHLADALRSIRNQAGARFHLLISDDQSEDSTLEIARHEGGPDAQVVVNPSRLGLAGNWNQCVTLSQTPFVNIFHQDDVMRPGHLAAHLSALQASDRVGLVASASEVIDDESAPVAEEVVERGGLGSLDRTLKAGDALVEMATANPLRCSAVTLRAQAITDVGGFDPSYRYVVDWDCWLRIARRWDLAWLARPTVAVRWHSASETHRFRTGSGDLDETLRLLDGLFGPDGLADPAYQELRRQAERRLARAFLNRTYTALRSGDPDLARSCLARGLRLHKGLWRTILADPRLALQLAAFALAPRTTARWLSRPPPSGATGLSES
jgi:glycosyltransferase involved in cell wall biosynthesis